MESRTLYESYELMAMLWWNKFSWDDKYRMFTDHFGHYSDFRLPDPSHLIYLLSIYGNNAELKGFPKPPLRYFTCSPDQFYEGEFIPFMQNKLKN